MRRALSTVRALGIARLVVIALLLAAGSGRVLLADDPPDALQRAEEAMHVLEEQPRHVVAPDRLAALHAAAEAMAKLRGPERPALLPVGPEATPAETETIATENQRRLRRWVKAREVHARKTEKLQVRWVKFLGEILQSHRFSPWGYQALTDDLPVSTRALELLVAMERTDAAREIMNATVVIIRREKRLFAAQSLLPDLFRTLGRLGSAEMLDWLRLTFVGHEKRYRMNVNTMAMGPGGPVYTRVELPVLILQTIAGCTDAPGAARRRMVRDLIRSYGGLEEKATTFKGLDPFWTRILELAVEAARQHAGVPTDEAGRPVDTLAALRLWLARHRDVKKAPWTDEG